MPLQRTKAKDQAKKIAAAAEKIVDEAKAADGEDWSEGVDIGRKCRVVDEHIPAAIGAPAKVIGQMGSKLKLEVGGCMSTALFVSRCR